ncbi:MAG: bacterial transcriptional activator domain-containing protein [Anaerolineae bacterium]|nr:bacterial transcriptional activator domain-containing protein [Anaerolineae bacterium]
MSSANVEGMLREGVNAMKAGRRDEARALLLRAVELDQYNEDAWLWLSGVLDSLEDQRTCLENVLSINPGNDRARQGLDFVNQKLGTASSSQPATPSALPPTTGGLSTSVEWSAPADAPPAARIAGWTPAAPEPTPEVLDSWVNNLGLQAGAGTAQPEASSQAGVASPFGDSDMDDDDDLFSAGPFRADVLPGEVKTPSPAISPEERSERRRAKRETRRSSQDSTPKPKAQSAAATSLFPDIPAEIKPTRLPGTIEQAPLVTTLLVILLVLANLAVAGYFMVGFFCSNPIHCPWV